MRRAARTDANHRPLFDLARELGGYVIETHQLGDGKPDGFCWSRDAGWIAVEVKTATGKLTADQQRVHQLVPIVIWRCGADVYAHFGVQP